jgi:acyl-CoA thioesterase-1
MKISRAVAVTATLSLAACGSGTQPGPPSSTASREAAPTAAPATDEVPILALGDSLFAGYGLKDGESYPAQLERALRERGINARIANAGVSGNTTADGLQRLIFTLDNQPRRPALAIVSLGGNDMLRGLKPEQAKANLDAILTEFDRRHIPVVLMGLLVPPNMGGDYARAFNELYPELATKHHAVLVPFFLEAVLGRPELVQPDHIHPTARGIAAIVAATVDQVAGAVNKRDGAA